MSLIEDISVALCKAIVLVMSLQFSKKNLAILYCDTCLWECVHVRKLVVFHMSKVLPLLVASKFDSYNLKFHRWIIKPVFFFVEMAKLYTENITTRKKLLKIHKLGIWEKLFANFVLFVQYLHRHTVFFY